MDDGSTICFENRTPLGQASCACRCVGSIAVCVCASTLTGPYGRRWTKPLGPCRRRCMLCVGVSSGTRQQRCAVAARVLLPRLLTPAPQPPAIGERVFFVVSRSNFIDDVAKLHVKGYDASGKDDAEVEEEEEFSDDEKARHRRWPEANTKLTARAYRRKRRLDSKGSRSASRGLKVPWTRQGMGPCSRMPPGREVRAGGAVSSSGSRRARCSHRECRAIPEACPTQGWRTAARSPWPTGRWERCRGLVLCRAKCLFRRVPGECRCRWGGRRRGPRRTLALGPGASRRSRRSEARATSERKKTCAVACRCV